MAEAIVFLAEGFEEVEALTPVDMMRRAGIEVATVGVGAKTVTGGHGIRVVADVDGKGFMLPPDARLVMLPGGAPGTDNLHKSDMVAAALKEAAARGLVMAALCAAPTVLHAQGYLAQKRVTAFPAVQGRLTGSRVTGRAVERDGNIITGRSAGVALAFAHALVAALRGVEKADEVSAGVYPGE